MDVYDELNSGRAEYAIGNTNALVERDKGTPVVILAVIFQHSPFVILSKKEANIVHPEDLIGKKICVYKTNNTILYAMLQSEGVDIDKIEIVELKDRALLIVHSPFPCVILCHFSFSKIANYMNI